MRQCTLIVFATLVLSACSARQGYEFVQEAGAAKAACERELTVAAQRACERAYDQQFEDYRRARQTVVEGEQNP